MNETTNRLLTKFQNEDYRYAYDEEFSYARMAMQIQSIRESQDNMTQKELADLAEMRQSRISELENVNYSMWTVSTLRRIARALGVRFSFKFESWSELLPEIEKNDREHLVRPRFEKDETFAKKPEADKKVAKETSGTFTSPKFATTPVIQTASAAYTLPLLVSVPDSNNVSRSKDFRDAKLWNQAKAPESKDEDTQYRVIANIASIEPACAA